MKVWLSLCILVAFLLCMGACGSSDESASDTDASEPVAAPATEEYQIQEWEDEEEVYYNNIGEAFEPRDVPDKRIPDSTEGMVKIEGGPFTYRFTNTSLTQRVQVMPFWIDKMEVSNADFQKFVEETGYVTSAEEKGFAYEIAGDRLNTVDGLSWRTPGGLGTTLDGKENLPVMYMSYIDARTYCEHYNKRLPTKVEFEFAASGTDHGTWCNGNEFQADLYNYKANSNGAPKPVDWGTPNSFGLYNMCGNVYEWAQDKMKDRYPADYLKDCPNTFALCGGSFNSGQSTVKARTRIFHNPERPYNDQGFRCVADVE